MNTFKLENKFYNNINDILDNVEFVKKGKILLSNTPAVFDIETSSFYEGEEKRGIMYAFTLGINGKSIRGRTWEEFIQYVNIIIKHYEININKRFIIYVQNLAYEFQFFKKLFNWNNVFSLKSRTPIYAITEQGIEFRCSYILSGMSLEKMGDNLLKYKVNKKVGDLDYKLIRHSNTPLNNEEWTYILNDGLVVMAYIQEEIEYYGNIGKIPLTKTGKVRSYCRDICLKGENKYYYSKLIKKLTMNKDVFNQLKQAFAGGFTHANAHYINKEINNVSSFDFTSSYPAVMLSEKYPMSVAHNKVIKSVEEFNNMLKCYCCLFNIHFHNIENKIDFENYISKSKCTYIDDYILNNGRVVKAKDLVITITEQDFFIIKEMYKWDYFEVSNFKYFYKDYLPKPFIECILKFYSDKTTLKGVEGKEVEYLRSKEMINSCYGMCVTNPCKDSEIYDNIEEWHTEIADIDKLLKDYNNSNTRFLYYAWGVWITAYARRNLFSGILEFKRDYIYSDTDSIKCLNANNHMEYINDYNKDITDKIHKCLNTYNIDVRLTSPKTIKGVKKPLGVWDFEGIYSRFKTLGAKRYMYEENNKIHITISGVSKVSGVDYLYWKYKNNNNIFKHFKENLNFPASYGKDEKNGSGKLLHTYIDNYTCGYITDYLGTTHKYSEYSAIHLEPTSYDLNIERAFMDYILGIKGDFID